MTLTRTFFRAVRQGLRTGVYGGPIGQTLAVVIFAVAVFVGAGLATGHITGEQLADDPVGTAWRTIEPTVRSFTGGDAPADPAAVPTAP
jgi:hypothetical protein